MEEGEEENEKGGRDKRAKTKRWEEGEGERGEWKGREDGDTHLCHLRFQSALRLCLLFFVSEVNSLTREKLN